MNTNYMGQVAKILGVEMGEEFKIEGSNGIFRITENGLMNKNDVEFTGMMCDLITGEYKIVKMPWKPEIGELFWFIDNRYEFFWFKWDGGASNLLLHKAGNCFKTKEEITPEVVERYKTFLSNSEQIKW